MKLSPAQIKYLNRAMSIGAHDWRGVYFSIFALGRSGTGHALLRMGVIVQAMNPSDGPPLYQVSEDGIRAWLELPVEARR